MASLGEILNGRYGHPEDNAPRYFLAKAVPLIIGGTASLIELSFFPEVGLPTIFLTTLIPGLLGVAEARRQRFLTNRRVKEEDTMFTKVANFFTEYRRVHH